MNAAIVRAKQGYMHPPLVVQYGNVSTRDVPGLWTTYQRIDATNDYYAALNRVLIALGLRQPVPVPTPPVTVSTSAKPVIPTSATPLPVNRKPSSQKPTIMNSGLRIGLLFGLALAAVQLVIDQTALATNLPIYMGPFLLIDIIEFPIIFVIALAGGYLSLKQSGRMSYSLLSGTIIGFIGMSLDIIAFNITLSIRFQQPIFGFVTSVYLLTWLRYAGLASIVGLVAGALGGVVGLRRAKR